MSDADWVDSSIKVGDVAIDLVERGKVQVVERAAETVAQYDNRQDDFDLETYKAHPLLDVTIGDPVWTVVYLPDKPTTNFSGTYDVPESRLARVPIEEANEDLRRFQRNLVVDLLAEVVDALDPDEGYGTGSLEGALASKFGDDLAEEAMELAEVDAVIGGGDESDA